MRSMFRWMALGRMVGLEQEQSVGLGGKTGGKTCTVPITHDQFRSLLRWHVLRSLPIRNDPRCCLGDRSICAVTVASARTAHKRRLFSSCDRVILTRVRRPVYKNIFPVHIDLSWRAASPSAPRQHPTMVRTSCSCICLPLRPY